MSRKILIIDDDASILQVSRIILEEAGHKVSVDDGKNIFEKIQLDRPDLILLDIRLAGLDGREIGKKLKSQDSTRDIPIVVLSASFNIEEIVKQAKADDYLKKPFDIDDLEQIVMKYLTV